MRYTIFLLAILISLVACNSKKGKQADEKCQSKPSAIFSDTMQVVKSHQFEVNGENSNENITLKNDVRIEILQSGCQNLRQEFRITRIGDFSKMRDQDWISGTHLTFDGLSRTSLGLQGLRQFAEIIKENEPNIKLGQSFTPDPSVEITIDKIINKNEGSMIIVFQVIDPKG